MNKQKENIINLWDRMVGNDNKAFEVLYHSLIKFCMMYVHQRELAEEIVSDVFVCCWLNRSSLGKIQNPGTYLFVSVKNRSLNHNKKYSNIHMVQIDESNEIKFVNTFNPQEEMEKKELIFKMDQAISLLPQQCRVIFRLIKEDGMKYKEVAEILNISPRTVNNRYNCAHAINCTFSDFPKYIIIYVTKSPMVNTANPTTKGSIERINTEFWITGFVFDADESYANWRRTSYPKLTTTQKALTGPSSSPGVIPRKLPHPQSMFTLNSSNVNSALSAYRGLNDFNSKARVWWDK